MEKMATNKTHNKSPVFKMGQLWHTIDDNLTAEEDEAEDEEDVNKVVNNETMKLRREDMSLFGICPAWDQFYLVVCEYCKQVIKPQALQKHIELRHSYHKHISTKQTNNSLKVRTDSTNMTTIMPSIRRTPPSTTTTTTTIKTGINENGSESDININININNELNNKLVNELPKSEVQVMLSSSVVNQCLDNNSVVVVDSSVDNNCVDSNQSTETNSHFKPNSIAPKVKSKTINLLSPALISTTIDPLLPEPTGPGPGFTAIASADENSVTISVPEVEPMPKIEVVIESTDSTVVSKPLVKKKSYKKSTNPRKLLPCKDRLYDPNKHCGVCAPEVDKPCTRSLTCKTHSLTLRRSVQGRIKNFDELLSEHREAKEAALRAQGIEVKPTKKAIQKQQQQLRASQLRAEQNQQMIDKTNCQLMVRTSVPLTDLQSSVSNSTTNTNPNSNTNTISLLSSVSPAVCVPPLDCGKPREPDVNPQPVEHRLNQIEVDADGTVHMCCHPRPAATCNFNIRTTLNGMRLLSRNNDLTLAVLNKSFNKSLLVSKLAPNQKCSSTLSSTLSPLSLKSPLRNTNQSYSANKKLCTSLDSSELFSSATDPVSDPYNFADAITTNNSFTYVKPKTTIAKSPSNPSKKKRKSDTNCWTDNNSSLLSNGQLFHTSNASKSIGSNPKKKNVVKKTINNSHSICASIPLTISNTNNNTIGLTNSNCEQLINPSTSLISEVPQHRNLNDILSNCVDSYKANSDNTSILLNGSLLSCKRNSLTPLSKQPNTDIKDSINKKTIFSAKSFNNNSNNKYLVNNLSPSLSSLSSALSLSSANSRPIIQKQTLPSSAVNTNTNISQSQNMSQMSQNLHNTSHNTTHTIFIKSAKQSLQNQLMPTITSPKLLSKTEDYTT